MLISIIKNEIDLIKDFIYHYRKLGVTSFYILDDNSNDGTLEFLFQQNDVTILKSERNFGTEHDINIKDQEGKSFPIIQLHLWRTQLSRKFAKNRWSVMCDADEFLELPTNIKLENVTDELIKQNRRAAWGVMIDLYPEFINDLFIKKRDEITWYFDGIKQFSLNRNARPRHHYKGTRRRLEELASLCDSLSLFKRAKLRIIGKRSSPSGRLVKPIISLYKEGDYFSSSHNIVGPDYSKNIMLPISHYYYHPGIVSRLKWVFEHGGYIRDNYAYKQIDLLLKNLTIKNQSLLTKNSRFKRGYDEYKETGNAMYPI